MRAWVREAAGGRHGRALLGEKGVVVHVNGFKAKFGTRFVEDVTGTHFTVYGPVSAEAKEALAGFNAVYMSPIDGFVRER
jgi:hypothetical protein